MPPSEARAMLLLLALAVLGQGVRHFLTRPGQPPGQVQLLGALKPASPGAQRDSALRQGRPLGPTERINVDLASPTELTRLPKVGIRLAKLIVADRQAHGPFTSLAGLDRVSGIGPGLLKILSAHVAFSGAAGLPRSPSSATAVTAPTAQSGASPLDLNTASISELDALPGIGPSKAAAILQYRERQGRFSTVDELERVSGFGPAAISRLRDQLVAR
ncbi:MAG: ComEA family DNA-binding protein [Gemmatimonadales bacterium]